MRRYVKIFFLSTLMVALVAGGGMLVIRILRPLFTGTPNATKVAVTSPAPSPTPSPSPIQSAEPSASPTPTPMSFEEMQAKYGPCVRLPILMYHHIQDPEAARQGNYGYLNVQPEVFRQQMEYIRAHGYTIITAADLIAFFDQGTTLPQKSVLITFDDGYKDFSTKALPILREFNARSVTFLITGLMDNEQYMSWNEAAEANSGGWVLLGNHTWSHQVVLADERKVEGEIKLADQQLSDHGLNTPKVFAYPYGSSNARAVKILRDLQYQLAFTTNPGTIQCKAKRLELSRIRIGNAPLANFGF